MISSRYWPRFVTPPKWRRTRPLLRCQAMAVNEVLRDTERKVDHEARIEGSRSRGRDTSTVCVAKFIAQRP